MHSAQPQQDVGVLVGRFQVHELHDGHRDLIRHVTESHGKAIVFLGVSPLQNSANNPLDFESRKQMLLAEFPDLNVLYIDDHPSDGEWSKRLDKQIGSLVRPGQSVILYGGRDSFIPHYTGKFPTQELMQEVFLSGSETRRQIAKSSARNSADFRAGAIWASQGRFPTAYQCVDVAVLDETGQKILLGRKTTDGQKYRLPGGFSDPRSASLEIDAAREVNEEMGVEIGGLRYVGSTVVEDWRYRSEPDCIKTALFVGKYIHGRPKPSDDMDAEVRWFDLNVLAGLDQIVPSHRLLMTMLFDHLAKTSKGA